MVRTDEPALLAHAISSGPVRILPAAVATPRTVEEVVEVVRWAEDEGTSIVPRGAGTGMPGGNVGPGIVLDLTAMDELGPVLTTEDRATVRVGPGAIAGVVEAEADRAGFFLPPLPSSADRCTVGGMVANNAAGVRTFRYGAIRDWVDELEVVLSDGEVVHVRTGTSADRTAPLHRSLRRQLGPEAPLWPRVRKNASGYALDRFLPTGDAVQLLVGSEGTLGVVTGATLRLAPRPPAHGVALLALRDMADLQGVTRSAVEIGASACELFGRRILEMAGLERDAWTARLARGARALLLLEVSGTADEVTHGMAAVRQVARTVGSSTLEATEPGEARRLWEVRRRASPTIARGAEQGLRSTQLIEDSVVPTDRLAEYVAGVERILASASTDAVIFGHAGDGNLHVNPLLDVGRPDWRERARTILDDTAALVAGLGGTLSGEHGDGRLRAPLLSTVWPDRLVHAFAEVKATLDPAGVFNPGVILPLPGQDPLQGLEPHGGP